MDELTTLVHRLMLAPAGIPDGRLPPATTIHIQQTHATQNVLNVQVGDQSQHFHIHAWDSKEKIVVSLDLLKEAFSENELLREYCELPEKNRLEPTFINTYVLEALMAVIRRAHRSPGCRNIRQNPHRGDQVQVLVKEGGERWEIITLVEATRLLFRDAAGRMAQLAGAAEATLKLTPVEKTASLLMPQEYQRRPEKYEREGKNRLAAHLATLAGDRAATGGREGAPQVGPAAAPQAAGLESRPRTGFAAGAGPATAPALVDQVPPPPAKEELKEPCDGIDPAAIDALLEDLADVAPAELPEPGLPSPTAQPAARTPPAPPPVQSATLPLLAPPPAGPALPPLSGGAAAQPATRPLMAMPAIRLPPRPPPFSSAAAAALLRTCPPRLDSEDRAAPDDLRRLEKLSGQEANRIVNHLWDAKEEGLLSPMEEVWAAALTRLNDGVD